MLPSPEVPNGLVVRDGEAGQSDHQSGISGNRSKDTNYGLRLHEQHQKMLQSSGIYSEHARSRGYITMDVKKQVRALGIATAGCNIPGLQIPLFGVDGNRFGYQYRPDNPRKGSNGKPVKYETPVGQHNRIDVPPGVGKHLGDPASELWVTEGPKKADSAFGAGLTCIALLGVYGWRGKNSADGTTALADWEVIALKGRVVVIAFDSDVMRNRTVRAAMDRLAAFLRMKGAVVRYCHLPDDGTTKVGLDDYLAAHTVSDLRGLVRAEPPEMVAEPELESVGDQPESRLLRKQWRLAARFAAEHRDKLLHVIGLGWHYWNGKRWERDEGDVRATRAVAITIRNAWVVSAKMQAGEAQKDFRSDIIGCETANGTRGVLELARVLNGMTATVDEMDADPYLLNTPSGTLDLRTAELRAHDPCDRQSRITKGGIRPDSSRVVFDKFLARVLPDEDVRAFVQRLIGSALLGLVQEHVLAIFTGTGQNGKTTLIEAVGGALGDYYLAAPPALLTDSKHQAHPTELMTLMGKRLVTLAESDQGAAMAVERMTRLTGGDRISARLLFRDYVEFTPSHTPIMVTNHLPQVPGDDPAVWRRLRVVPFSVAIPDSEKDVHLPQDLQLEADGILSWALAGYVDYHRRGLAEPPVVLAETQKYHTASDLVEQFIQERCLVSTEQALFALQSHVWAAWQSWCASNQRAVGRQGDLLAALTARPGIERTKGNQGQVVRGLSVI